MGRAGVGVDAAEGQRGRAILPERAVADDPVDGDVRVDVEITIAAAQVDRAVEGQGAGVGGVAQAEVGRAADDQVVVDRPGGRAVAGKDRREGVVAVRVDGQRARADRAADDRATAVLGGTAAEADLAGVERRAQRVGVLAGERQRQFAVLIDAAVADRAGEADVRVVGDRPDRAVEVGAAGEDQRARVTLRILITVVDIAQQDVAGDGDVIGEGSVGGAVAGKPAGGQRQQSGAEGAIGAGQDPAAVEVGTAGVGVGGVDEDVAARLRHRRRAARTVRQHGVDRAMAELIAGRSDDVAAGG